MNWVEIDGSRGEGGGQILRSSLALSAITGKPVRFSNIRSKRRKPGLRRQHLTCVKAAKEVCGADVTGDELNSTSLEFIPGKVTSGNFHFNIGSAGSTSLVLQTILYPLLQAEGPSEITIEGGTHNPMAPTADFLQKVFFPVLKRMGPEVTLNLDRYGFYPAGGGKISISIRPSQLKPIELLERGKPTHNLAQSVISSLAPSIGHREVRQVAKKLSFRSDELNVIEIDKPQGPGNVLAVELGFENVTEIFTSFGEMTKRAEQVAGEAVREARNYLKINAPVGEYLADQLLIPVALAGDSAFQTTVMSNHSKTNIESIEIFLGPRFKTSDQGDQGVIIETFKKGTM